MPLDLNQYHVSQQRHITHALAGFKPGDVVRARKPFQARSMYADRNSLLEFYDPNNLTFENISKSAIESTHPSYAFGKHLFFAGDICLITELKPCIIVNVNNTSVTLDFHQSLFEVKGPFRVLLWMTLMADNKEWVYWTSDKLDFTFRDQMKLWKNPNL